MQQKSKSEVWHAQKACANLVPSKEKVVTNFAVVKPGGRRHSSLIVQGGLEIPSVAQFLVA